MWSLQVFTDQTSPPGCAESVSYCTYCSCDIFRWRHSDVIVSGRTLWGENAAPKSPQVLDTSAHVCVFMHMHVEACALQTCRWPSCMFLNPIPKQRPAGVYPTQSADLDLLLLSLSFFGFIAQLTGTGIVPVCQPQLRMRRLWSYIRDKKVVLILDNLGSF